MECQCYEESVARWGGIQLDLKYNEEWLIFHMKLILTMYSKKGRTFCRPEGAMRPFQKIYQEPLRWFPLIQLDSLIWGFDSLIWEKCWKDKWITRGYSLCISGIRRALRESAEKGHLHTGGRLLRVRIKFSRSQAKDLKKLGVWWTAVERTVQTSHCSDICYEGVFKYPSKHKNVLSSWDKSSNKESVLEIQKRKNRCERENAEQRV